MNAVRLGDLGLILGDVHVCPGCPHVCIGPTIDGSNDVFINGRNAIRKDDPGIHAACCGPNTFKANEGSSNVFVNGKPLVRLNDQTKHCGGMGHIITGSPNVYVN